MNQLQKRIISLQKKPKARREERAFVIEGRKLYEEIPRGRCLLTVVSESFARAKGNESLLKGKHYETVSDSLFESMTDTKTPQGILAVVRREEYTLSSLLRSGGTRPLLLLLEHLQDPGNLGTIFRAAEAAGVCGILMDEDCVDVYNPKTIRGTMGAIFRVPFCIVPDMVHTTRELKAAGVFCYAADLGGKCAYDDKNLTESAAFMIGNEANGLSEALKAEATDRVIIPMLGKGESLNAAMAATILMFEAARQRRKKD